MELRHLRYFIAVAEELHFARAAERLRITPPSLTQQIQVLEAELGARLVNRTKRSVELTDAGGRFLEEARKTIQQADHTVQVGKQAGRGEVGRIEIAYTTSSACSGVVGRAISMFRAQYPLVELHLRRLESPQQLVCLAEGDIDAGFMRPPNRYPIGLTGTQLGQQPILIALQTGHPLAQLQMIPCRQLAEEKFVMPSVESEFAYSGYVGAIADQGGFTPQIIHRAPDYLTIVTLVSAGLGLAAVPESFSRIQLPGVCFRPTDLKSKAELVLAFRRSEQAPAIRSFVRSVKASIATSANDKVVAPAA
jgi:DNA-binding transcriptional LysR family regulator